MNRQITIIGGGLGGLALASGLSMSKVPVEVFEAGYYPRHRVCGEFMAGLSDKTIQLLGLDSCFSDAIHHASVGFFRNGQLVRKFNLPAPVLGISRYALDQRMAELVRQRGGRVHEGIRHHSAEGDGIIRADGRRPESGGYCGMKGHWGNLETITDLEVHLGNNAYVGLSKVETGDINVCGLFASLAKGNAESPLVRFTATLHEHGLADLADRLAAADHRTGSLCSVSALSYKQTARKPLPEIGDRQRAIPPFTGNGMTIAIESAAVMVPLLVDYVQGKVEWDQIKARSGLLLRKQFAFRYRTASLLHPFLLTPALQSILMGLAHVHLLPFSTLYRLTHS